MSKYFTAFYAAGLAITLALPAKAQDASTVLATVNGTEITLGHVIALQDRLPEQYKQLEDETLYKGMLDQLIQQTALSQAMEKDQSKRLQLGLENETRAYLAGELLAKIGTADIDSAEIDKLYEEKYTGAEAEFNASHILLKTKEEAEEVKKSLDEGADFEELAKEKSTGPSAPSGGSLGWFVKGAMVPKFEDAVMKLEDGAVSEPVETEFGWHVIKRNETRQKEAPKLEDVKDEIERELRGAAIEAEIKRLTDEADVTRAEVEIDPSIIRNADLLKD